MSTEGTRRAACDDAAKSGTTRRKGQRSRSELTPLVDKVEVARYLGTSVRHVQRLVTERRMPYVKVGHFIRFDLADVAEWVESLKVDVLHVRGNNQGISEVATIEADVQVAPPVTLSRRPTSAAELLARWTTASR